MAKFGVAVQRNRVISAASEADAAVAALGPVKEYVVKAQVHAGGRGKGFFKENGFKGGVHVVKEGSEAASIAQQMLGHTLVTKQTGEAGVPVNKVMIAQALDIAKEYYFAILLDRAYGGPVIVASSEGGVDIEEVAESNPDAIIKEPIDIMTGPSPGQLLALAEKLGFGAKSQEAADQMAALYKLFEASDCTQVEINPFVETPEGDIVSFDAKLAFDDNASFRQEEIFAMRDTTEEDPREVEASKHDLNFIGLDGSIGCLVNGAGLAMATLDIITMHGGSPANFLDVGGGATEGQVKAALTILKNDPNVKSVLVNIFGGIMKCDTIANGVVAAAKSVNIDIPIVIRLAGTNAEIGERILNESGLNFITAHNLDDAAAKAVKATGA
jgi:succinyl-CoA synthetase beta subunit